MKIPNLGYLPLQDHNPEATDGFRGILYAVRTLGFDAENRPLPEPGTAGDLCGPVVFKPVGEDRGACAAWAFAMPVVGQQSGGLEIKASTGAVITGGGSGRISTLTPAMGPDSEGNLQPAAGLEHLSYARDGRADHVYNLAGDKKLAPGAGGILVSSLDPGKQLPLLLDASPLIAVNQAGDPDCGTPVYDLKDPDGSIDHTRFARLQSFWRVKQVIQPNKSTFTGITPGDKATFKNGALAWQLSSGGPSHLHGGGLVYDDAAIDETPPPSTDQTRVRETTKLGDPNNEGALTQLGPGQTRVRQPSLASDQAARAGGTARPVFYWQTVDVPGTIQDRTVLRKPNPSAALAMMSARRGGPVDVGGNGCQHQIGETTDGERVNAAHLSTRTLMRSPLGREGPLDYTDEPYSKPPASLFKTRAHIKFDAEAGHDWVLGTGLGRYRLEAESLFTPPPPIGDPPPRKPKDEDPPKPPPGVRQPPDIDSLLPWIIGDDLEPVKPGKPAKPKPGNVLRSVMSPASPTSHLVGPEGPKGGGQSPTQRNQTSGGCTGRPLSPVASDFSVDRPGDAMAGGRIYVPGLCFVAPEQRPGNRIATGGETLVRPETGGMLMHGGSGVSGPTLVADPCKKNRPVSKGGVAFVGPCYSLTDLYNGTATKTGQEFQLTLPPGATQIAQGTPTTSGTIKNGFVESVATGGASTTKIHKDSTATSGAGTQQTSTGHFYTVDSSLNVKGGLKADGSTLIDGQSGATIDAAPSGHAGVFLDDDTGEVSAVKDDGTVVSLETGGGGGGSVECPPLYGGSGLGGSVTRATGTNLEVSAPYEVVNLTMEGSACIRGTAGIDLDVRVQGNFDASTCSTGKISMDGRAGYNVTLPTGGAGSDGHTSGSNPGAAGSDGVMAASYGSGESWAVGGSLMETTGGGGGGSGGVTGGAGTSGTSGAGGAGIASALTGGAAGAAGSAVAGVSAGTGNTGGSPGTVTGPSSFYRAAFLVGLKPPC